MVSIQLFAEEQFVPEVGKKKISNNFWVVNTAAGNNTKFPNLFPLGIHSVLRKKAQLCADELENFLDIQEIHMPLQINH